MLNFYGFILHSDEFCCVVLHCIVFIMLCSIAVYCTVEALKDSLLVLKFVLYLVAFFCIVLCIRSVALHGVLLC